ncbi:hypothetical protein ETAA8_71240 [Anatilimnocola aggregata]|uniref:3-keto-alpha-glucoside-1,2-lyase/3-keto-2-hydroxy-glucal hydratase domain-containing protein n=1 Tax=Anatilimnocola aggregata TaxID=2528021 RepID=A0A517YP15_9BACT|nr:DUF1080 domain-containing protein [Anatilimnocola aggregata]QDU31962.1 hypothetical protein ETAA8_71240 [Anatilimnocola aggregata]
MRLRLLAAAFFASFTLAAGAMWIDEYKSGIIWPMPPIVDAQPDKAPSDAIVLFDGTNLDAFNGGDKWEIADGAATAKGGGLTTKEKFGDCQIHVEFATPAEVKGKGQGRGNSGIYLMGRYEVQVLDSYENETYFDGQCGSVYKQQPPMVNASRKPGEWQTMDIIFTAPKFNDDGSVASPAYVTVLHNGVLLHNHFELHGGTSYVEAPKYKKHADKEALNIQFHGNPVRFRNIWLRENIHPLVGQPPTAKEEKKDDEPKGEEKKPEDKKSEDKK